MALLALGETRQSLVVTAGDLEEAKDRAISTVQCGVPEAYRRCKVDTVYPLSTVDDSWRVIVQVKNFIRK